MMTGVKKYERQKSEYDFCGIITEFRSLKMTNQIKNLVFRAKKINQFVSGSLLFFNLYYAYGEVIG